MHEFSPSVRAGVCIMRAVRVSIMGGGGAVHRVRETEGRVD